MENYNLEAVFQVATNYGQICMMKESKKLIYGDLQGLLPKLLLKNKGATVVTSEHFHSLLVS